VIRGQLTELVQRWHNSTCNKQNALAWLQKGFDVYAGGMYSLKVDAVPDPLRSDPHFQDLLRRMNFPP
jgi:hypothetical protein